MTFQKILQANFAFVSRWDADHHGKSAVLAVTRVGKQATESRVERIPEKPGITIQACNTGNRKQTDLSSRSGY